MGMTVDEAGRPLLAQFSEEGFVDCVFRLEDYRIEAGRRLFHLAASFEEQEVGIDVSMVAIVKAGMLEPRGIVAEHVYYEGVQFFRSGEESGRLISATNHLYGFDTRTLQMVRKEALPQLLFTPVASMLKSK